MFFRKEGYKEFCLSYPLTALVILLNTLVMLYALFFLDSWNYSREVFEFGGIAREYINMGEYWRLFSYAFLHQGLYHYFFNILFIFVLAPACEKIMGKLTFMIFLVITIVLTSITVLVFTADQGVGASGFVFGLIGFYFVYVITNKIQHTTSRKFILQFTLFSWAATFIFSFITQQLVSTLGHAGGFVAGILFGLVFRSDKLKYLSLDQEKSDHSKSA